LGGDLAELGFEVVLLVYSCLLRALERVCSLTKLCLALFKVILGVFQADIECFNLALVLMRRALRLHELFKAAIVLYSESLTGLFESAVFGLFGLQLVFKSLESFL